MYTMIATAKLNDVDPQAWLADVLARIADTPQSRLADLLPWNWKAQDWRHEPAPEDHRIRQRQRDRHGSHRIARHRSLDLARGRGADLYHAQGTARRHPSRDGLVRLPSLGVHHRQAEIRPADGRGLGNGTAQGSGQGAPARRPEAAHDDDRLLSVLFLVILANAGCRFRRRGGCFCHSRRHAGTPRPSCQTKRCML